MLKTGFVVFPKALEQLFPGLKDIFSARKSAADSGDLTFLGKEADGRRVELQDILEYQVEHPLHVRAFREQSLVLLQQRDVLSDLLVCIEQLIESISPSASHLDSISVVGDLRHHISWDLTLSINLIGPQMKATMSLAFANILIVCSNCSMASKKDLIRFKFIIFF